MSHEVVTIDVEGSPMEVFLFTPAHTTSLTE
jgi:hypothetical protein